MEALVWPGQEHRLAGLRAACDVARADPPRIEGVAAQAPTPAAFLMCVDGEPTAWADPPRRFDRVARRALI